MKKLIFILFIIFQISLLIRSPLAFGEELSIISVRKSIPLSETEPSFRDLYLNQGAARGIKKDQVYQVFRATQVRNASGTASYGEVLIPVGEVKIIAAYERIAVARDVKIYPRETYPTLDVFGTMSGDQLELIKK